MSYWIFVHKSDKRDTLETFHQLMEKSNWGLPSKIDQTVKKFNSGDYVVFYLGGNGFKYLIGEAKVRKCHKPSRGSIGGPENQEISSMVELEEINLWKGKIVELTLRSVRKKLNFIKNKDNWGMSFHKSVIQIQKEDYEAIKSFVP